MSARNNKKRAPAKTQRSKNASPGAQRDDSLLVPALGDGVLKSSPCSDAAQNSEPVRLQKYLADCGVASRRHSEDLIVAGRVAVNGETVTAMGTKVTPGADEISVDGHFIEPPSTGHVYYLFHKPRGVVVTADDPQGRRTIYDYLGDIEERVIPVGRLDRDSEGLLLLTNDGELAHRLMHPRYGIEKEYEVLVEGEIGGAELNALREGVEIEEGVSTRPAGVYVLERTNDEPKRVRLAITIAEGKKRQVRKMITAVGGDVRRLRRVREGSLTLEDLPYGRHRRLTREEIEQLKAEVGL